MRNAILILGDQLSHNISSLRNADPDQDLILMAEVHEEASYTRHHRKKLILLFSAMRHFAAELEERGFRVHYQQYHPNCKAQSLEDYVARELEDAAPDQLIVTECGEHRLHSIMQGWQEKLGLPVDIRQDNRFLTSHLEFQQWAEGRKQLRMEHFYHEMRRKTGLLMTSDGQPEGGDWNFDEDNREKWKGEPEVPEPFSVEPDEITQEVIELVERYFKEHPGSSEDFHFAVTAADADRALAHFLDYALPHFGTYQDAMATTEDWLFHSILSPYMNCGLLDPMVVCEAVAQRYYANQAPLNAVEGFIRQIIGWREFIRGIYWLKMPEYAQENYLGNRRKLPWFYWTGETGMNCMHHAVDATLRNGYAHHIQRLMVTGNFALLTDIKPEEICDWYLAVYVDAYDWVELPNTLGMVMHADGGLFGSKPYAASGKYINRMSDYCKDCRYKVADSTGEDACPFNALYWHFINRHEQKFSDNPRMSLVYANWRKQKDERKKAILERGDWLLDNLDSL